MLKSQEIRQNRGYDIENKDYAISEGNFNYNPYRNPRNLDINSKSERIANASDNFWMDR